MGTLVRSYWTDDQGDGMTGTPINNDELQKIYTNIEYEVKSPNANIQTWTLIDSYIAGGPFTFGGDYTAWVDRASYATGFGYDESFLIPGTTVWQVDRALTSSSTWYLEAMLRTNNATYPVSICLVEMLLAPDSIIPGSEISTASTTPAFARSAGFTLTGTGIRQYAVKIKTAAPAGQAMANAYGVRIARGL